MRNTSYILSATPFLLFFAFSLFYFFKLFPLDPLQSYRMNSSPRGFALVISNVTFDTCAAVDLDPRKGGEVDDEVLRKVFTELDYVVAVHRDLTAQVIHTQRHSGSL